MSGKRCSLFMSSALLLGFQSAFVVCVHEKEEKIHLQIFVIKHLDTIKKKHIFTAYTAFLYIIVVYLKAVRMTLLSFANCNGKHVLALCFLSILNCF